MSRRKILILEDEAGVAEVYASRLRTNGLDTVVCYSFPDARECIKQELPDGLLTDIRVGEFNGLQLAHLFRSLSPDGVIVIVTGHDDPVMRREGIQLGASFIVKPIDINRLADYFCNPTP